eukprot:TRINITY_DN76078_c0_g1_i1.p1 TRINITY_DN76078_c0_g1~~TRINITY_DN76078_c0_g1_i1.p1  ORF type:complete len:354 (-),score=73.09 TRINITY_DN76078_c0_g1_i1:154-1215(-)
MEATLSVTKQTGVGRFRIDGFSLLYRKKGDPIASGPIIEVGDFKWEILVYPTGNERCKDGWIRVSVRCLSGKREVRALYSVSVVNVAGEVKHRLEEEALFTCGDGWGFDNFIRLERLTDPSKGFNDDVVIFEATVTVLGQETVTVQTFPVVESSTPMDDLLDDLKALWNDSQSYDLTLEVNDVSIRAHGVVLAARSPVFARMLQTQMTEASTRIVKIEDFDAETVRALCEFIYTGQVGSEWPQDNPEVAGSLLHAAAKYEVHSLVRWCSSKVAENLSLEIASDWLRLASQAGPHADELKQKCLQIVASNISDVQTTEGWQRLMANAGVIGEIAPMLFQAISPQPVRKRQKLHK